MWELDWSLCRCFLRHNSHSVFLDIPFTTADDLLLKTFVTGLTFVATFITPTNNTETDEFPLLNTLGHVFLPCDDMLGAQHRAWGPLR